MASRAKRVSSWDEPLENVVKARQFAERFGLSEAHPSDYLDPLSKDEAKDWNDLLNKL